MKQRDIELYWEAINRKLQEDMMASPYPYYYDHSGDLKKTGQESFWILWNPASNIPPSVRFYSKDEALRVAKDMASKHRCRFYVVRAEDFMESPPRPAVTHVKLS